MLSEGSEPDDIVARARALPERSLAAVAAVVGARDGAQALEGFEGLTQASLERLRQSLGKMGLE